jgi:hypothetical protein
VVVGTSEVVASTVLEVVRTSVEEEISESVVVTVAVSVIMDKVASSVAEESWASDVAVAVEDPDSEMNEDKSVVEGSAPDVVSVTVSTSAEVANSVETERVASIEEVSSKAEEIVVEGLGLHGPACPWPQSASAINVREKRVAFILRDTVKTVGDEG